MDTGSSVLVNASYDSIIMKLEPKTKNKSSGWIPCKEFEPDVDDDYIVSIGKDAFASYSVDVDSFKGGRWKTYGRKVLAWMPFPDPYDK
jgi:hypothetical protein